MSLGTWSMRGLYRSGSLTAVARELGRYKSDLVAVLEVRWNKGGTVRAGNFILFCGKVNENNRLGRGFFCSPENSINS
jgi:hypothetical protein